jgi:hypothetical protein
LVAFANSKEVTDEKVAEKVGENITEKEKEQQPCES